MKIFKLFKRKNKDLKIRLLINSNAIYSIKRY